MDDFLGTQSTEYNQETFSLLYIRHNFVELC